MSVSMFEKFRQQLLAHATESNANPHDIASVRDVFINTHNFLASNNLASNLPSPGFESLGNIPKLVHNSQSASAEYINMDAIENFVENCRVPIEHRFSCALEVARILTGANEDATKFVDRGRAGNKSIPMRQIYDARSIAMIDGHAAQALESFGEYSDRVTSDSRLSVTLAVLRAHKSLIDRILPRKATEDPVVLIKIINPEVYNLEMSQNPSAAIRYTANRQPMIELYRNPTNISTEPQQIVPLKVNDTGTPASLVADNIIVPGVQANLLDLTLSANKVGYQAADWTDLVSDGGAIDSLQLTVTQASPLVVEVYTFSTRYLRGAQFVTQTNVQDSGDRAATVRTLWDLTAGSLMSNGQTSVLLAGFTGVDLQLDITFNATLNIKTAYVDGAGGIASSLVSQSAAAIPAAVTTTFNGLTTTITGWSPHLFFSEENMRKTTAAVRMLYKEQEFLIPVGRNYIVDYSIMGQEVGEETTNAVSEIISIGNSWRSVNIINGTLTSVYNRLQYELANPNVDFYHSVAADYAAGTRSLPHVWIGTLDVSHAAVMRESERLSDLHSYVTSRMLALIADGHNKSMYTDTFEAGERARYKVITSGPIAEILFGISQYWNTLDDKVAVAENSDYSLKLPNGTQLDIIKSNFEYFANLMLVIPVRQAKPDDLTSFGTILDRGTFVGQYTPVSNGAANKRIVANSREILFPTNPLGYIITVQNLSTEIQIMTDGPGMMI